MKFATVVVAFVSFCLVSSYSNPAFAAVIDAGDIPASAGIVEVTTRDETSDGPGRRPRRTLGSKKNPAAAAAVAALGVSDYVQCYARDDEQLCKGVEGCIWYPHWLDGGGCSSSSGVSCGEHLDGSGEHRAPYCSECPHYDNIEGGESYCNGRCYWIPECKLCFDPF